MIIKCICGIVLLLLFVFSLGFLVMYCTEKEKQVGMIVFLSIMTAVSIILIIVFAYNYKTAKYAPKPVICCAEVIGNSTSSKLGADTVRNIVIPYKICNAKGDGRNYKKQ